PLAFGTVERWSLTIMECLCVLALLIFLVDSSKLKAQGSKQSVLYEIPGIVPLLCLWAYHVIQIIPLPPDLVKLVSPETHALYESTIGLTGPLGWISLSLNKKETLQEILRMTAYGAFYIVTIQLLTKKELLKKTVAIVTILASAMAFQGILQHFINNHKLLWLREVPQGSYFPFGPFVNRNHYAGFMEMLFPVAFGAFLAYKPGGYTSLRQKLLEAADKRANIYILLGFASVLIAVSIFLSLSRGGILSWFISMMILGLMVILTRKNDKMGMIIVVVVALIMLSVTWFGWDSIFNRFEQIRNIASVEADARLNIWKDTTEIIRDFPVTGTGFGSFVSIYPKYQTVITEGGIDHAHNDYIELLTDGGIIAFVLTSWFLLEVFWKSYKSFRLRKETYSIYLYLGSLTGLIAILIHSLTDFNLHIASNGLYFFFLSGLAVSTANTRLRDSLNCTYLNPLHFASKRLMLVSAAIVLITTFVLNAGFIAGDFVFAATQDSRISADTDRKQKRIISDVMGKASLFDPLEASYYYKKADTEMLMSNLKAAMPLYLQALKLDPVNGEYLQRIGLAYSDADDPGKADKLMQAAIACDRLSPVRYENYVSWLFNRNRKEDAMKTIKTALSLFPDITADFLTLMPRDGLSSEEILSVLPARVAPYIAFGEYLCNTGKEDKAEDIYMRAFGFMSNETGIDPNWFYKVVQYYTKKGLNEKALTIIQQAKTYLPKDAGISLRAAELCEQMGMRDRAIQEYEDVLAIEPVNIDVRRRLDKLQEAVKSVKDSKERQRQ
ncbi:MAG TPA: O-antigen ligase family protein, partial [Dissulfurispiraceae bacterium]|nr:O-antigen ligase family protein [Dissulfurispiraceae bacterium]